MFHIKARHDHSPVHVRTESISEEGAGAFTPTRRNVAIKEVDTAFVEGERVHVSTGAALG